MAAPPQVHLPPRTRFPPQHRLEPFREDRPIHLGAESFVLYIGAKQLKVGPSGKTPTLLIAARADRGTPRLTQAELDHFCRQRGIAAHLARYEVGDGHVCGFRQEDDRAGELDFVLYFGTDTSPAVRMLFQGLFESFLARRNLTVFRYEPVQCVNRHVIDRVVVRKRLVAGSDFACCAECGEKTALPRADQPIQLSRKQAAEIDTIRRAADQRSRFEQVLFRLKTYVTEQAIQPPQCFISYAWGVPEHERWVEKRLATDLQKAGIGVLLDRWENNRIGSSIARFVERIEGCGQIIVVGTPLYRQKAKNEFSDKGSVVAAEWDLVGIRMLATERQKQTVLPVLLAGEEDKSFPALLRGRVYGDFRKDEGYLMQAFNLILDLYGIPHQDPAVADLRESLQGEVRQ